MMDLQYLLLLLRAPRIGYQKFYQIIQYFGDAQAAFQASNKAKVASGLFNQQTLEWFATAKHDVVTPDLRFAERDQCYLVPYFDSQYPGQLLEIAQVPPLLYVKGDVACLSTQQLAIVGSRNPTAGGVQNAQTFSHALVDYGLTITSGLAIGIDGSAHRGALAANGKTIAVCGTGLDRVYPARHQSLADEIIQSGGALVSEFPIGTPPSPNNFPKRNTIISGLSLGTLVIEATLRSGSLITARLAAEQGREVFAIPSSIHNHNAQGCHLLIKQGAVLAESPIDIISELQIENTEINPHKNSVNHGDSIDDNIDNMEHVLLKFLSYDPITVDELIIKTGLDFDEINEQLLMLELSGTISNISGSGFVLAKAVAH